MSTSESQASTSGGSADAITAAAQAAANAHASIATLPKFWPTRPEIWFIQAETIFEDRIPLVTTDKAKANLVLRALPCDVLEKVEHVVTGAAPVGGRYPALKSALIDCYGRSQATRYADLIELTRPGALGDKRPMEFFLHMRSLSAGDNDAWERAIFLNAMPPEVRTVLSNSNAPNNKRLAIEAGQVWEQHRLSRANAAAAGAYAVQAPLQVAPQYQQFQNPFPAQLHPPAGHPQVQHQPPVQNPPPVQYQPAVEAVSSRGGRRNRNQRQGSRPDARLCIPHFRYGSQAFTCHGAPCPMRSTPLAPRPQAPGNGRAGR